MKVVALILLGLGLAATILVLSPLLCKSAAAWQSTRAAAIALLWIGASELLIGG